MTRSIRLVFLASLALNLVLGVGLAWLVVHHEARPTAARDPQSRPVFHPEALRRALPEARGDLVDTVMVGHRDAMRARIERLSRAREQVREAMRHEPFERERLDTAFAQLREAENSAAQEAQSLIIDLATQATPEERERLSDVLRGPTRGERRSRSR